MRKLWGTFREWLSAMGECELPADVLTYLSQHELADLPAFHPVERGTCCPDRGTAVHSRFS